jgi:hypothetical protein
MADTAMGVSRIPMPAGGAREVLENQGQLRGGAEACGMRYAGNTSLLPVGYATVGQRWLALGVVVSDWGTTGRSP